MLRMDDSKDQKVLIKFFAFMDELKEMYKNNDKTEEKREVGCRLSSGVRFTKL